MLGFRSEGASMQEQVAKELFRLLDAEKNMDVYPVQRIDSLFERYGMQNQEMARFQLPFLLKRVPAHIYVYGKLAQEVIVIHRYWWMPLWGKAEVKHKLHLTVLDGLRGEYRYIGTVEGSGVIRNMYLGWLGSEKTFIDPMLKHKAASEAIVEVAEATAKTIVLSSRGVDKLSDSVAIPTQMNLPQIQFGQAEPLPDDTLSRAPVPEIKYTQAQKDSIARANSGLKDAVSFKRPSKLPVDTTANATTTDIKPETEGAKQEDVGKDEPPPEEFLLLQEGMKW